VAHFLWTRSHKRKQAFKSGFEMGKSFFSGIKHDEELHGVCSLSWLAKD
jgi:hypothetical protein